MNILLTGDDGYNSVGIRTLARILREEHDLKIAATLDQQSGTGGKINMKEEMKWDKTVVEGVEVLWVDGSPVDAVEVAHAIFKQTFDLTISGINLGSNLTYSLISSGTFSAAVRALAVGLSTRAVVMSLQTFSDEMFKTHKNDDDMDDFLKYPGGQVHKLLNNVLENNFWDKEMVNINFPISETSEFVVVKPYKVATKLWKYPLIIDETRNVARQPDAEFSKDMETDPKTEVGALRAGKITVAPFNFLG